MTKTTRFSGFTLVELLVTLGIITLLLSMSLVAINNARIRSRDAKRIADLRTIQSALEQHVLGDASHTYPPDQANNSVANYCLKYDPGLTGNNRGIYTNRCFNDYLSVVPKDPNNQAYQYASPACFFPSAPTTEDRSGIKLANKSASDCQAISGAVFNAGYGLHTFLESDKNQDASVDATPNYPLSYDLIP